MTGDCSFSSGTDFSMGSNQEERANNQSASGDLNCRHFRRPLGGLSIRPDDLRGPEIAALLQEHLQDMIATSPAESRHVLDLHGLRQPGISFWSAWEGAKVVGCGALKELETGHAEIKSMRTARSHRGRGIGKQILTHLITEAKRHGYYRLSLETGAADFFKPAHALYRKFGFKPCPPFANYRADPNSLFLNMTLRETCDQ